MFGVPAEMAETVAWVLTFTMPDMARVAPLAVVLRSGLKLPEVDRLITCPTDLLPMGQCADWPWPGDMGRVPVVQPVTLAAAA